MSTVTDYASPEAGIEDDLYFVFDEDSVQYFCKSSDLYFASDGESMDLTDKSNSPDLECAEYTEWRSRKASIEDRGFTGISAAVFSTIVSPLEDQAAKFDDSCGVDIFENASFSSRHKDYRRFRHYDLIRSKLNVRDALCASKGTVGVIGAQSGEKHEKVKFDSHMSIKEFFTDEKLKSKTKLSQPSLTSAESILRNPASSSEVPVSSIFSFNDDSFTSEMHELVSIMQEKFSSQVPADFRELNEVMSLAKKQAGAATENVLCAFEGVSSTGKCLIEVINRLQASAQRFLLLNDSAPPFAETNNIEYEKQLRECLYDCEELQSDIKRFKVEVEKGEKHMMLNCHNIASGIKDTVHFSKQVREMFTTIYEKDSNTWETLSQIINASEDYTKCVNFLSEMTPERVFQSLEIDFNRIQEDTRDTEYLCSLLLKEAQNLASKGTRTQAIQPLELTPTG